MVEALPATVSDRKLRLVAAACCRRFWDALCWPASREAVRAAEAFAEGDISQEELDEARMAAAGINATQPPQSIG
jgi:hypothetical protein